MSTLEGQLRIAASRGNLDLVKTLLKENMDLDASDVQGWTPLLAAAAEGHNKIAELLLKNGADINQLKTGGFSALHLVIQFAHKRLRGVRVPIEVNGKKCFTNQYDKIIAANKSHPDSQYQSASKLASLLIKKGININLQREQNGKSALMDAAAYDTGNLVDLILSQKACEIDLADERGLSAMHFAIRNNSLYSVKALIKAGANQDLKDNDGFTPLHEAASRGHLDIIKAMIAGGADPNIPLETAYPPYDAGNTAKEMAQLNGHDDVFTFLKKKKGK